MLQQAKCLEKQASPRGTQVQSHALHLDLGVELHLQSVRSRKSRGIELESTLNLYCGDKTFRSAHMIERNETEDQLKPQSKRGRPWA